MIKNEKKKKKKTTIAETTGASLRALIPLELIQHNALTLKGSTQGRMHVFTISYFNVTRFVPFKLLTHCWLNLRARVCVCVCGGGGGGGRGVTSYMA